MVTRRRLLQSAIAAPAILRAQAARRPNILFCIADDQSYPHASAYGTKWVSTPGFDRVAKQGVLFHNTFVSCPSCCPSRGSVLTGQDFWRLKEASMNHTVWPGGIPVYTDLLAEAGYHTGFTGKGWGPGNWQVSARKTPLTGPAYNVARLKAPGPNVSAIDYAANFEAFLKKKSRDAPFCFWAGFQEPHRQYDAGIGVKHGKKIEDMEVPGFLPDTKEVCGDLADYAFEIEWHDRQLERILALLEKRGELENTIVVVTADNGMPFPRAKANLYDYGTRMPLAVRWGAKVKPGRTVQDFVSFTDFAPTFLEAAGVAVPGRVTGRSLMPLLESGESGQVDPERKSVCMGIERHFPGSRPDGAGYPSRAIRTAELLYIQNLSEGNPMGDRPGPAWPPGDPTGGYGDADGGPSKTAMVMRREEFPHHFHYAFGARSREELYEVRGDRFNMTNVIGQREYQSPLIFLRRDLEYHRRRTSDPRIEGEPGYFEAIMRKYPVTASSQ